MIKTRLESWSKHIYSKLSAWYCELLKKMFMPSFLSKRSLKSSLIFVQTNICAHLKVTIPALKFEGKENLGWANDKIICSLLMQKVFFPSSILSKLCIEIELSYFKNVGDQWKYLIVKLVFHFLWIFGTQNSPLTNLSHWKF